MNKTKKYIEVELCSGEYRAKDIMAIDTMADAYEDGNTDYLINQEYVVELPDLASMSDLEKLEWVLKEIGTELHYVGEIENKQKMYDLAYVTFDANGKIIK